MNVPVVKDVPHGNTRTHVAFTDIPTSSSRRWEDLLAGVLSLAGVVLVWGLTVVAFSAAQVKGVEESGVFRQLALLPLAEVEGMILLAAPLTVLVALLIRGELLRGVHALISASAAVLVGIGINMAFASLPSAATQALRVHSGGGASLDPANVYILHGALVALATFLLVAGEASAHRSVRWSWALVAVVALSWVVRGYISFSAAVMSVLFGHSVAMLSRWVFGMEQGRARPGEIIRALRSVGVQPSRVVARVLPQELAALGPCGLLIDLPGVQVYSVEAGQGSFQLFVFSPSQRVVGALSEVWQSIRLRGISRWVAPSRKAAAERALLAVSTAENVGISLPHVHAVVEVGSRYGVVVRCRGGSDAVRDVCAASTHHNAWQTLELLHGRAVTHRNISPVTIHHGVGVRMGLSHWEYAQVGASSLALRVDQAQLLAALAVQSGDIELSVLCAREYLGESGLRAVAPLLQRAVLPNETIRMARQHGGDFLSRVRECAAQSAASVDSPVDKGAGVDIARFSLKTVVVAVLGASGVVALSGMLDLQDIAVTLSRASGVWVLVGLGLSSLTWVGGALTLVAFTPKRVSFRGAVLAQVAASFVTLVAPAGTGPAGVNIRFLTRQKVGASLSLTVVVLQQVVQLVVMLLVLALMVALTGASLSVEFPRGVVTALMFALTVLTVVGGAVVALPRVRRRAVQRVRPTWNRLVPQIQWVLSQPSRLAVVGVGNVVMNIGFIGAFWASMRAVGVELPLSSATVVYLTANSLGSVVPSPGGIGAVEAALTAGLQVAGVPLGAALPVAVVYRVVTFYGRVPLGWVALNFMQKRDLL